MLFDGPAYAVTGVARDDLPDGGAWLARPCISKELNPSTIELLIPASTAEPTRLAEVFESRPEVLAHNVETVPVSSSGSGRRSRTGCSLGVLTAAPRDAGLVTKSSLSSAWAKPPTNAPL